MAFVQKKKPYYKSKTKNRRVVQYESAHNKPVGTG